MARGACPEPRTPPRDCSAKRASTIAVVPAKHPHDVPIAFALSAIVARFVCRYQHAPAGGDDGVLDGPRRVRRGSLVLPRRDEVRRSIVEAAPAVVPSEPLAAAQRPVHDPLARAARRGGAVLGGRGRGIRGASARAAERHREEGREQRVPATASRRRRLGSDVAIAARVPTGTGLRPRGDRARRPARGRLHKRGRARDRTR